MSISEQKIIQFSTTVDRMSTLKDGSIKVILETQELVPEDIAILFSFRNKQCWAAFKSIPLMPEEIKEPAPEDMEFPNVKSPSERLRNVLWVLSQKKGIPKEDFESFRTKQMERFINRVKAEIEKYN